MPAYKDTKTNTWYAKFSYKNWKGETKFTTKRGFSTKREAASYESEFKNHISGNVNMTFEEFAKLYAEERYPRVRKSTIEVKENILTSKILPFFKHFSLSEIKSQDIVRWQNELIQYRNPNSGKPYSATYLRTVHNEMSSIMNYAVKHYDLKENPVQKAGAIGSKNKKGMTFWTLEEYLQFADEAMADPFYFYCFEVLYWTGIREGELLALSYEDFDFEKKTISISKTYQIIDGEELIGPPKTEKGNRIVKMTDRLTKELQDYFSMDYDFSSSRAFSTTKWSLKKALDRYAKKAGVKRIRVHDLRHSHVSLLINMGFSPVEIAERVGHESITITLHYAHMFPTAQEKMVDKLDSLLEERKV